MDDTDDFRVVSLATGRPLQAPREPAPAAKRVTTKRKHRPNLARPDETEGLASLQLRAGLTDTEGAQLCDVTLQTWRRWRSGEAAVPVAVRRLLLMLAGDVPSTDRAWRGFTFRGDELVAPNGEIWQANELQHRKCYEDRVAILEARLEQLEFWRTRAGRSEQVRLARSFGALDAIAVLLVNLHQVIDETESPAVKCEAGTLWTAVNELFRIEARLSKAAGLTESA